MYVHCSTNTKNVSNSIIIIIIIFRLSKTHRKTINFDNKIRSDESCNALKKKKQKPQLLNYILTLI